MKDFQIRDVMNRRKSAKLEAALSVRKTEYLDISIMNKGSILSENWCLELYISSESMEISQSHYGLPIISGMDYLGARNVNIDLGELEDEYRAIFVDDRYHYFRQERMLRGNVEMIFPRSQLKCGEVRLENYVRGKFACYWRIDADDGTRTYGVISPNSSRSLVHDSLDVFGEQFQET